VHWVNEDAVSGLNVDIENSQAIAQAIKDILEDKATEDAYRKGAADRFNRLFKKEMMVRSFIQLYNKVTDLKA
jgi:glycosyltransferase involved in cell wall biosynthesis